MTKLKEIDKVFVALDNMSLHRAERIIEEYKDKVHGFKINHSLLHSLAPYRDLNIFVDLKLWDIPNTVKSIVNHAIDLGASYITISTLNNPRVFDIIEKYNREISLLGVTSLTSWTRQEEYDIHHKSPYHIWDTHVSKIIDSFSGIISSVPDLPIIDKIDPDHKLLRICPGIRTKPTNDDQKRTATPTEAFNTGADYLVMGRSFYNA